MFRKSYILILILALLSLTLTGCLRTRGGSSGPVDLTFYGLDNSDVFDPIISEYQQLYPAIRIKYKKFNDSRAFENLLVNEIAEGEGPDIFYLHNTWLPRHTKKIVPLVSDTLTPRKFPETFVNVSSEDFIQPDPTDGIRKIYALPLYVDTLALYYNKQDFEEKVPERGKPAGTWDQLKEDAFKFQRQGEDGKLQHGEIALGRADNIRLSPKIFWNLLLQAGVNLYDSEFKQVQLTSGGQESFDYFLSFAGTLNKNYSWSTDLVPPDRPLAEVEAFLSGKVSAILAYSDLYARLETELKNVKTRNPSAINLKDVKVAPIPQIAEDEADYKAFADYYGLAVSRNSKNAAAAWSFIQFATGKSSAQVFHQKTKRPTARRDLIADQKKEPVTDVFASQLGYAASLRIFSDEKFETIIKEAIQNAVNGQNSRDALGNAQARINDLLKLEAPLGLYPKPKKK
ncbi:MAG: extracellular solute-binding protein [Patescibacteria group bacterium]